MGLKDVLVELGVGNLTTAVVKTSAGGIRFKFESVSPIKSLDQIPALISLVQLAGKERL